MTEPVRFVSTANDDDVAKELQYLNLNELRFVRAQSAMGQWHLLVTEAWNASGIPRNEFVRDYLVIMLNRFANRANLFETLSSFDYCQHVLGVRKLDSHCIQDVADMSLQYVAFFPEQSSFRHQPRSLGYSGEIGSELYHQLARDADNKDDWFSQAYKEMANSFGRAVMVLRSACPRFVHRAAIRRENEARAQRIPSALEARRIAISVSGFEQMFCEPSVVTSSKIN